VNSRQLIELQIGDTVKVIGTSKLRGNVGIVSKILSHSIVVVFDADVNRRFSYKSLKFISKPLEFVEEESPMLTWAKKEIEIACRREKKNAQEDEWDYGCACYGSALRALESLCEDGHSGMSIDITQRILNRLIEGKPLTPIDDIPDVWIERGGKDDYKTYQCTREGSLFKYVHADGSVKYHDLNRVLCLDKNTGSTYRFNLIGDIIDKLYPITMPYMPGKPYIVSCEDFLTDRKNGDFDTVGVFSVKLPDGKNVRIRRFFKEDGNEGWKKITESEYYTRKEGMIIRE